MVGNVSAKPTERAWVSAWVSMDRLEQAIRDRDHDAALAAAEHVLDELERIDGD